MDPRTSCQRAVCSANRSACVAAREPGGQLSDLLSYGRVRQLQALVRRPMRYVARKIKANGSHVPGTLRNMARSR